MREQGSTHLCAQKGEKHPECIRIFKRERKAAQRPHSDYAKRRSQGSEASRAYLVTTALATESRSLIVTIVCRVVADAKGTHAFSIAE